MSTFQWTSVHDHFFMGDKIKLESLQFTKVKICSPTVWTRCSYYSIYIYIYILGLLPAYYCRVETETVNHTVMPSLQIMRYLGVTNKLLRAICKWYHAARSYDLLSTLKQLQTATGYCSSDAASFTLKFLVNWGKPLQPLIIIFISNLWSTHTKRTWHKYFAQLLP